MELWGTPPLRKKFQRKGCYGFGGYPPPFTDKICKVVFEVLPKEHCSLPVSVQNTGILEYCTVQ